MSFSNQNGVNNQLRLMQELTVIKSQMNQLQTIVASKGGSSSSTCSEVSQKIDDLMVICKDTNTFVHYIYNMLQNAEQ